MIPSNKLRFIKIDDKQITIKCNNNKLTSIIENNNSDIIIDAIFKEKRITKIIDSEKEKEIPKILNKMESLSKIKAQKFYKEFPEVNKIKKEIKTDKKLEEINLQKTLDEMLAMNKELLKNKMVLSLESNLEQNKYKKTHIAKDFRKEIEAKNISLGIELSLKNKTEFTYYYSQDFFKAKDLDFNKIKKEILKNIEEIKDPEEFKGSLKEYNLVFCPETLNDLISKFIIQQIKLENKIKKDSYLETCKFNKKINIYEDPFVDYSPYSKVYDNDLIETKKKYIIQDGKQKNYLANLNDAFKYKKQSTGNAISGLVTNIIFVNGNNKKDKLLKGNVILINNIIGMHTTNAKEGSLNVSATGIQYKDGKRIRALKDIKISEKIQDLFKKVEISKETKWVGNYNLPYMLCKR